MSILKILVIIVFVYLAMSSLYLFIFSFLGLFKKKNKYSNSNENKKIAVLIPGYKEDSVIIEVAKEATLQNYPKDKFDVVIIADSFLPSTISQLKELPIKLIEVEFDNSTKSKALNKAMQQLDNIYDIALVLDADNIMQKNALQNFNNAFTKNIVAIQGHRVAKNINTPFAILDSVSEEINNHIFRKGHRVGGLSSALIGSGMAFKYSYFKKIMKNIKAIGGFDKELEMNILRNGDLIEYLHDVYIYDEKIQQGEALQKQRKRWLSAQFIYFRRFFFSSLKHLIKNANVDFFDKVIQMILPPRILQLGLLFFINIIIWLVLLIKPDFFIFPGSLAWLASLLTTMLAMFIAIPKKMYNVKTLKAVLYLPKGFIIMFLSLFKLYGANKKFIHTEHTGQEND